MSICWYCHWGWPKPVADIFLAAKAALDGDDTPLLYGPAHVVWADENFDCAPWCLEHFGEYSSGLYAEEQAVVRQSLEQLAALPSDQRDIWPEAFGDRDDPENYPPPPGMEMVRINIL